MAINPAGDKEAEEVVKQVWLRHRETQKLPIAQQPIGLGFYHQITQALSEAGLLVEGASRFNSKEQIIQD